MEMRVGVGIKQENKTDLNHKIRIGDVSSISFNTCSRIAKPRAVEVPETHLCGKGS